MKAVTTIGAAALLSISLLAGCGGSKKIAAHVNQETITEDEFYDRALNVDAISLGSSAQIGGPQKAGDFAIQNLVFERLILQLGAEKKVLPTDAQVNEYIAFAKKYQNTQQFPEITFMAPNPLRTEDEWRRDAKIALVRRNLAMAPLKITDVELKKWYEDSKSRLTTADEVHLRLVVLTSEAKAQKALDTLKSGIAFETVALTQSEDPATRAKSGDIGLRATTTLPPEMVEAVKNLKPGDYTTKPVKVAGAQAAGPAAKPTFLIMQLVERKAGQTPSFEESRLMGERSLLQDKDQNAIQRVNQDLQQFRDKAKITVEVKGYEHSMDKKPAAGAPVQPGQPAPGGPGATGATGAPATTPPGPAAGAPGR